MQLEKDYMSDRDYKPMDFYVVVSDMSCSVESVSLPCDVSDIKEAFMDLDCKDLSALFVTESDNEFGFVPSSHADFYEVNDLAMRLDTMSSDDRDAVKSYMSLFDTKDEKVLSEAVSGVEKNRIEFFPGKTFDDFYEKKCEDDLIWLADVSESYDSFVSRFSKKYAETEYGVIKIPDSLRLDQGKTEGHEDEFSGLSLSDANRLVSVAAKLSRDLEKGQSGKQAPLEDDKPELDLSDINKKFEERAAKKGKNKGR